RRTAIVRLPFLGPALQRGPRLIRDPGRERRRLADPSSQQRSPLPRQDKAELAFAVAWCASRSAKHTTSQHPAKVEHDCPLRRLRLFMYAATSYAAASDSVSNVPNGIVTHEGCGG